jgi:hypothetical protein
MLHRNRIGAIAAAMLTAIAVTVFAVPAFAADMKYPDFESQWRNPAAANGAPWDPSKPAGLRQQAPLTPEYQKIFEASVADQAAGGRGNNYQTSCVLDGMPRIMSLTAPMEILIQPAYTILIFENAFPRRIYTDGRKWPTDEEPSFEGYSVGRWIDEDGDGRYDVLEVETRQLAGPRALESSGLPLHRDNETVVKERIHLDKDTKDILHDQITTIDNAFTHPWTVDKTYVRERHPKWSEYLCREAADRIYLGRDEYAVSPDGKLMPVRENQPPPDLRYFKPQPK